MRLHLPILVVMLAVCVGCGKSTGIEPIHDGGDPDGRAAGDGSLGGDASPGSDAGCDDCINAFIGWTWVGGMACWRDSVSLAPCRNYIHSRLPEGCPDQTGTCNAELAACGSPDGTDAARVNQIIAHPHVTAALLAAPVFYGRDDRPMDGVIMQLTIGGLLIEIGSPCGGDPSCVPIPPGVAAAAGYFNDLSQAMLGRPPCVDAFP